MFSTIATQSAYSRIFEKGFANSYYLGVNSAGTNFKAIFANGAPPFGTLESTTVLQAGKWYHVAATHDGANDFLYINGIQESTQANTVTLEDLAAIVTIGADAGGGTGWTGHIDDVRIYNTALTAAEVRDIYNEVMSVELFPTPRTFTRIM